MKIYRLRLDRHTVFWTVLYFLIMAALAAGTIVLYDGGYAIAWVTSFLAAMILLIVLAMPRKLHLYDDRIEIRCLLDITTIPLDDITAVRAVDARHMRRFMPLFGSCGFFGFYGLYLDLRALHTAHIYASQWNSFIEIKDIYEERHYIACPAFRDEIIEILAAERSAGGQRRDDNASPEDGSDAPEAA